MVASPLRHQVERTKNKHSRAVVVDDTVVIRLAKNLSKREEALHIEYLLRRMNVIVLRERQKTVIHPFRSLLSGHTEERVVLADGRAFTVRLQPAKRSGVRFANGVWTVNVSPNLRTPALHRLLWSKLSAIELERVSRLVHEINDQSFRVPLRSVRLRIASSQWGSCSCHGAIMLNTALLFLPERLTRYVVIHELAHRLVQGHDRRFWSHVEDACPDYKELVREMKEYRLPKL